MLKGSKLAFLKNATGFAPLGNIYAPYYRQMDGMYCLALPLSEQDRLVGGVPASDARVNKDRGVVICSTVDVEELAPGNRFIGKGVYHPYDYLFYYYNIRENAANRVRNFLRKTKDNAKAGENIKVPENEKISEGAAVSMKVTRIYTGKDGESHFDEVEIPLSKAIHGLSASEAQKTSGITFIKTQGTFDFHNAPHRQFVIFLDGGVEIETGGGEKKTFNAGDILLAEDTTGRGHIIRALDDKRHRSIFITLD
jgi:quercetin dioxygenase-like cupin family protein